jgi:IS5 family transposase
VVSDASVHDSQKFEDVLDTSNTASDVWADSAYRSQEIEEKLGRRGLKSRIHRRAYRNRELSEAQKAANTTRSKVRARVSFFDTPFCGRRPNLSGASTAKRPPPENVPWSHSRLFQADTKS